MERLLLLSLLLLLSMQNYAQEVAKELKDSKFSLSLELSSKYMWRGLEYGDAPTVFLGLILIIRISTLMQWGHTL